MPDPGFIRPDLCSIHAATEQPVFLDAVRRLLSAGSYPLGDDGPLGGACLVTSHRGQLAEAGR
jgi:hypothetical protein